MKRIVFLTGAGMSAESGIKTFRDADGLWEGHDVMEVASPEGFAKDPALVLDFYNQRRRQLLEVVPNAGHTSIAKLEENFAVDVVTQNVDDLHERAGSSKVLHLHGELLKVRSTGNSADVQVWKKDLNLGDICALGHQIRPHIVWFGEAVPALETAAALVAQADIVVIVGTSMQVYPAASLISFAQRSIPKYYIDPKPKISYEITTALNMEIIEATATDGMQLLTEKLLS